VAHGSRYQIGRKMIKDHVYIHVIFEKT